LEKASESWSKAATTTTSAVPTAMAAASMATPATAAHFCPPRFQTEVSQATRTLL